MKSFFIVSNAICGAFFLGKAAHSALQGDALFAALGVGVSAFCFFAAFFLFFSTSPRR